MAAGWGGGVISVWGEAVVGGAGGVAGGGKRFPVRRTSRSRLREVDFQFVVLELKIHFAQSRPARPPHRKPLATAGDPPGPPHHGFAPNRNHTPPPPRGHPLSSPEFPTPPPPPPLIP